MAFDSFGEFVSTLDKQGELTRISSPVATELEITEIADREMKKPGGGQALLFEAPMINGHKTDIPLAINTMGSSRRMATVLGRQSVNEAAEELGKLIQAKPPTGLREAIKLLRSALELRHAKPKQVTSAPCKDIIEQFNPEECPPSELPTLLNLPVQKCWPQDGVALSPCPA